MLNDRNVMEERLRSEGVAFTEDGRVRLDAHRWRPQEELGARDS